MESKDQKSTIRVGQSSTPVYIMRAIAAKLEADDTDTGELLNQLEATTARAHDHLRSADNITLGGEQRLSDTP